ncbi:xanthine dehydrogenase accessory factor [Pseudarthrobacter sp. PvP004]|uniref:XdhC family protein n=1 Tax=Pseudarthrobacter sp. PvP004 TaxID=2817850 RepID=UPI001AE3CBA8|nr:XdhC family protein [Pseudarthrobacter sp. PvP004]MBP2265990.1 xanthine dehydrogenase accessory factor [Pseudarthrobacter sp. PvP004]
MEMREVMETLEKSLPGDQHVALATVVRTEGSAPRAVGTSMLVTEDGSPVGSVSGGCIEASVIEAAAGVLASGVPELHRFGISDDDGFGVGLTCGGSVEIFIQKYAPASCPQFASLQRALNENLPCAMVTIFDGGPELVGRSELVLQTADIEELFEGSVLAPDAVRAAGVAVREAIASGSTTSVTLLADAGTVKPLSLLIDVHRPARRLLIFGAIDFSVSLAQLGAFLGFHITVCDARAVFATAERIPSAHEIVVDQPARYLQKEIALGRLATDAAICVLTHDAKFDVPVLDVALRHGFAYIGAMGSRRTASDRRERLIGLGHTDRSVAPLRSPIGLGLSASTPAETAVSIMAEIIAAKNQSSGLPLAHTSEPIHRGALEHKGSKPN